MRSNDVLFGMPCDFVQFTSMQEILAGWLDLDIGSYSHYSYSLHLYQRDVSRMGIGQGSEFVNTLHRRESEKIIKEIHERMRFMLTCDDIEKEIYFLLQLKS